MVSKERTNEEKRGERREKIASLLLQGQDVPNLGERTLVPRKKNGSHGWFESEAGGW
jgi:hypothetical protein